MRDKNYQLFLVPRGMRDKTKLPKFQLHSLVLTGVFTVQVFGVHDMQCSTLSRSPQRSLGKVTALGVLCCFVLLLASFFLPSYLIIIH